MCRSFALSKYLKFFVVELPSLKKFLILEAVAQRCSVKKVFLEISQNLQENICVRVSGRMSIEVLDTITSL